MIAANRSGARLSKFSALNCRNGCVVMRKIAYGNWILLSICSGCGASTGLSEGFWDSSQGSTVSTSTGGAGAVGGGGVYWTGGASYVPSGGYGAMVATGGSPYYPTGGTTYYYPGGAKATGGSYYNTTGGKSATGGSKYTGGNTSTGGKSATGGSKYTGGNTSTGGKSATGGSKYTGGSTSTGGKSATGGTTYNYTGGYTGTGGGSFTGAMKIATDGYVSMQANMYMLHGYVNWFASGSNTSITVSYGTKNICATGIVETNPSYLSYAGININVNQTSASSSVSTTSSLTIDAKYITISFSNDYNAPLRFQLNSDTGTYWCYDLTGLSSPVTILLDSFRTSCWDPASGYPFKPGTAITSISMVVPGDTVSEYKYDICFYGVTFQ